MNNIKKAVIISICLILFMAGILFFGKDLFKFSRSYAVNRNFSATVGEKELSVLTGEMALKRGAYQFSFIGQNDAENNAAVIFSDGKEIERIPFPLTANEVTENYTVKEQSEKISLGVYYDAKGSLFTIKSIRISSSHVLYKDHFLKFAAEISVLFLILLFIVWRLAYANSFFRLFPRMAVRENEKIFFLLILITALESCLLFQNHTFFVSDTEYHLGRILGIKTALEAGIFPTRIHLFFAYNYGYGSGLFYPDTFLFFPAVLSLLGFDAFFCYKVFLIFVNFFSALFMYFAGKNISGGKKGGLAASAIYSFAYYRLLIFYNSSAVGQELALVFFPLIIWGVWEIFNENPKRWYILSLGCIGVALSHTIGIFLVGVMLISFLIIKIRTLFRNRQILISLIKAFLLTALGSSWFIFPLIEQMLDHNVILTSFGGPYLEAFPLETIFSLRIPTSNGAPIAYIGLPLLFLPFFWVVFRKRLSHNRTALNLLVLSLLAIFFASNLFPWHLPLFQKVHLIIQFPFRFMGAATALLCVCGGLFFSDLFAGKKHAGLFLCLITGLFILDAMPMLIFTVQHTNQVKDDESILNPQRIGNGEYLPISDAVLLSMKEKPFPLGGSYWSRMLDFVDKNGNHVISSDSEMTVKAFNREGLKFTFAFHTDKPEILCEIPLLYYKGYHAVLLKNGEKIPLQVSKGYHGLVSVHMEDSQDGKVTVWYGGTLVQKISDLVSLITFILMMLVFIRKRLGKKIKMIKPVIN